MALIGYEWILVLIGIGLIVWLIAWLLRRSPRTQIAPVQTSGDYKDFCDLCKRFLPLRQQRDGSRLCGDCIQKSHQRIPDSEVIEVAKKYGGVLTKSVMVFELKTSLEVAELSLERFCKHGEARKVAVGSVTLYDFPSTRTYLGKLQNQLIEQFLQKTTVDRATLAVVTGAGLEALNRALAELESQGIVTKDPGNAYRLAIL